MCELSPILANFTQFWHVWFSKGEGLFGQILLGICCPSSLNPTVKVKNVYSFLDLNFLHGLKWKYHPPKFTLVHMAPCIFPPHGKFNYSVKRRLIRCDSLGSWMFRLVKILPLRCLHDAEICTQNRTADNADLFYFQLKLYVSPSVLFGPLPWTAPYSYP